MNLYFITERGDLLSGYKFLRCILSVFSVMHAYTIILHHKDVKFKTRSLREILWAYLTIISLRRTGLCYSCSQWTPSARPEYLTQSIRSVSELQGCTASTLYKECSAFEAPISHDICLKTEILLHSKHVRVSITKSFRLMLYRVIIAVFFLILNT